MKRIIVLLSAAFILALLFAGCGHLSGNDPLGVTGGGSNGYGSLGGSTGGGFEGGYDNRLLGGWQSETFGGDYYIIRFFSSGDFELQYYSDGVPGSSYEGSFHTYDGHLVLAYGDESDDYEYTISGSTAYLSYDGATIIWHRI
jgi:hypothetical protein